MSNNYLNNLHIKILCKKFIRLELYDTCSFKTLSDKLHDKEVISHTRRLLSKLNLGIISIITTKKFLSCFMIRHHPAVIISDNTNIEKHLCTLSNKLLEDIKSIYNSINTFSCNFYISKFKKDFMNYMNMFDIWKSNDKLKILNDLSTIYFELEHDKNKKYEELDDLTNHEFIVSIEREQKKLLEKIELIGGQEGLEYINNLKKEIDSYKEKVQKLYVDINDNLHQAYWHSIHDKLSTDPPDFKVVIDLLQETKDMLLNCKRTLENELNEHIDIDFITDMLNNGVLDDKYILNMCNYIITKIKECQAINDDKNLEEWRNKMSKGFVEGAKYCDFFPMFFKEVFERLDNILKDIDIIKCIRENMKN